MSVCAIIVSYRTGAALKSCLAALAAAQSVDEIILVDNGNPLEGEALIDAFASHDMRARVLRGHGNVGFSAACNLAAQTARSDALAFVNPDVILAPGAIPQLAEALRAAPPPAIVGGDLRDERGATERGSRRDRLTLWRAFVYFTGLSRLGGVIPALRDFNRHREPMPAQPARYAGVSGALMMTRRADFQSLGGFDEGYFLHVEDIDICRRAEEAGWRVLFAPGPHGVHLRSSSDVAAADIARHKSQGMARYFRKFARGPIDRAFANAAGAVLIALAPQSRRE